MQAQLQQTEKQRLERVLDEARQAFNKARAELNQCEQDMLNTEARIRSETHVETLATLQGRRDASETLQARLRRVVESKQSNVNAAKRAIEQNIHFIQEVQRNISNAPTVRADLLRRKTQAEETARQAQAEVQQAQSAIEQHDAQVRGYESQLARLGGKAKVETASA